MSGSEKDPRYLAGVEREILRILDGHRGRISALLGAKLFNQLLLAGFEIKDERKMRDVIHGLRRLGYLICAAPGEKGGYYMATSLIEADEFCDRELHPKGMDILETESVFRRSARQQYGEATQINML